jgi:hypothetical protein
VYPALKITSLLNLQVSKWINKYHPFSQSQQNTKEQTDENTKMSDSSQYPDELKQVDEEK